MKRAQPNMSGAHRTPMYRPKFSLENQGTMHVWCTGSVPHQIGLVHAELHQVILFKHSLSWVLIPIIHGLYLRYLALVFTSVHHIHSLDLTKSSYPFIPSFIVRPKEKQRSYHYSKCPSTPLPLRTSRSLIFNAHILKTKMNTINRRMKSMIVHRPIIIVTSLK